MVIDFSAIGVMKEQPSLILRNADGTVLQTLGYAYNLKADIRYNEVSTITFDIPASVDGVKTPHYDDIIGMRIIDMKGWGQFILMNPSTVNDGAHEIKSCKAYSLEYELTYKQTYFEEATYNFWDPLAPDDTVLGILLSDMPLWSVGSVDESLIGKYRTFSEENANVYNFIKSTVQQTYHCIFDFDTYNRKIYVRSADSSEPVTNPVYISFDNLAKEIQIDEDTESIVTVLDVNGGENVDIRMVNPLGTNKIYNLDYFMNESHFSQSLITKWNAWKTSYENYRLQYYNLSIEQALKTSAIITEQARLADMENSELATLQSERAVYVAHLAQLTDTSSAEYAEYQGKLNTVNSQIASKEGAIAAQKTVIEDLEAEQSEILDEMKAIANAVSMSLYFTEDELNTLELYFKEDSIEDSSFVLSAVESYTGSDISNETGNLTFSFSGGTVRKVRGVTGKDLFTISGGSVTCSGGTTIRANVISASFERTTSTGSFALSIYLSSGNIGTTTFPKGCLSFTGTCIAPVTDAAYISVTDPYAIGTTLSFATGAGRLYFTRNTTEYDKYAVEWDLYDYGRECLNSLAYPSYTFSVTAANFLMLEEFESFVEKLALGEKIYFNTGSEVLEPICIGFTIDYENTASLSLLFGDKYSASDSAFKLVELLDNSIAMGKTLNSNKLSYSAFVDSGASGAVKSFMDSALDVARNKVLSSTGQGISWDETGLHLRKYTNESDPGAGYDDEQIWMINNAIVFTDDGWQTAKMAIGKIIDENLISEDNPEGTAYGIVAPYIVGTLLAGRNLIIDTEDGAFKVDSSGVYIDSLKFYIAHGGSTYDTLENELSSLSQETADVATAMEEAIAALNERVDGTIATYYQSTIPTAPNDGDLWYNTTEEKLYRYSSNSQNWNLIEDAGITTAIAAAQEAQETADRKINTYYQNTDPSVGWTSEEKILNIGDMWYNTSSTSVGNYAAKKVYRWNGVTWQKLEDGAIETLTTNVNNINTTLSSVIAANGYLKAAQLAGVISTQNTQMKNSNGDVLFDEDGLWLLNSTSKSTSTKAVWINENGILVGTGNRTDDPGDPDSGWTWTTAIGHDGITAEALASKTLSAVTINGGTIMIGGTANNPAFKVDSAGNLTANSGTFKGTLSSPTLSGNMRANGDSWLIGAGLSVGGNPTTAGGNFYVDTNGNVTMKGNINLSSGTITWGSNNSPVKAQYSVDGISNWHNDFQSADFFVRYSYDGGITWTSPIRVQGQSAPAVKAQYSVNGSSWHDGYQSSDYYARYSYDDGGTWSNAIQIRGRDGINGSDGSDAYVTFNNINAALGNLFGAVQSGRPATINQTTIYAPVLEGGTIRGCQIYAGTGTGYTEMTASGLNVVDPYGLNKIGLGYYNQEHSYPYLILGAGSGENDGNQGVVMKFAHGIWIGSSNVISQAGAYPPTGYNTTNGIFVDFNNGVIYKYINGSRTAIGSESATAVFG